MLGFNRSVQKTEMLFVLAFLCFKIYKYDMYEVKPIYI